MGALTRVLDFFRGESAPVPAPMALGGGYEGAAQFDKQIAHWQPGLQSADMDLLPSKDILDARSRDLGRNDAYVQSGASIRKDSVVGAFFMLNAKPYWTLLGRDEAWAEAFQEEVEAKFTVWAESPRKWVDASGQNDLTGLVRLAVGLDVFGGEVLAKIEWLRDTGRDYKTAVQMIDSDRLLTPYSEMSNPMVRGGIRHNVWGRPQSAFIRTAHPFDYRLALSQRIDHVEVPFEKPWGRAQVVFIREQQRVAQTRAVADIVTALREIAMTRKFRDVSLQNAVLQATYAATIESELPAQAVYEQLGAGMTGQSAATGVMSYAESFLAALNSYIGASKNITLDGIKVPHLFPGTKLNMQPAKAQGGVGESFESSLLRYMAAAFGCSYEELTRDFSKTNYSSARAAMGLTGKFMASRKRVVADTFANHIYRCWLEEAVNQDKLDSFRASEAAVLYTDGYLNTAFDALSNAEWIGAARPQIDELKETQAAVLRIKFGLSTREDELSRLGKDWRKVFSQLEREAKEAEKRNLVFAESDNMMNAAQGTPREQEQDGTESDDADG